jgi:hypothetical protein
MIVDVKRKADLRVERKRAINICDSQRNDL